MVQAIKLTLLLLVALAISAPALAQEAAVLVDDEAVAADVATKTVEGDTNAAQPKTPSAPATNEPAADLTLQKIDEVVVQVDQNAQAQEVKTSILAPIYKLAETFSFPAFHWLAFTAMVTGVVSFTLQLVLGKLIVLSRFSLSPTEILSDALGLVVSLIGLVLTTQAATENSTFTASSSSVLSATGVGAVLGLIFYVWGQRQELQAVEGRRAAGRSATTDVRT